MPAWSRIHRPSEFCQQLSVMEEEAAQDLRNTQYEVPVGDGLEHVRAKPLPEFHDTFLMAGWAEISSLAGEGQQPFCSAPIAANPGEAVVQVTTLQVPDDYLPEIRSPEAIALLESLLVNLLEGLEVILYALVVRGEMGLSSPVDRASFGHGVVPEKRGEKGP